MGTLTVKLTDFDESVVEAVKNKHNISTKTKALMHCLNINRKHEEQIARLEQERKELLSNLAKYREHSLDLLSGIAGLQDLTEIKLS